MDSFFSIQKLSATGAFCPERKAFFISISRSLPARNKRLPREKNDYKSQLRGRNDYRLAQITMMPARMSTAAMPMARLIGLSNAGNLHIPALVNWLFAEEIRSLAARKKSASFSIPMKRRPVLAHATPVVPLPIELSNTV